MDGDGLTDYAALSGRDHVSGAEVLDSDDAEDGDVDVNKDGWLSASEDEDSDGEWIDVIHSSDDEDAVKVCIITLLGS